MIMTPAGQKRVLFLDDHVPYPELGVGYPRARRLILNFCEMGHSLTFLPLEFPDDDEPSARRVLPLDVELVLGLKPTALASFLRSRIEDFDLIFVSRPANMRFLRAALAELPSNLKSVPILYDAEAIFAARDILQRTVEGTPLSTDEQKRMLEEEMSLARAAAHVTAVSETEAVVLREAGCHSVSVLSDGFQARPTAREFSERGDLLFIGALDDDPSPNVDALLWFVENVLPRVKHGMGAPVRLVVAGRCAAHRVRARAGPDVVLLGKVADLDPLYDAARVVVAPHRYAAGIPNKVLEAAAYGVPCVISELLAGHLEWRNGVEVLTASTAEDHSRAILQLYSDEELWLALRTRALNAMDQRFSPTALRDRLSSAIGMALQ